MLRRVVIIALLPVLLAVGFVAQSSASTSRAAKLPIVKGGFGAAPTITFPSSTPPTGLVNDVLHTGTGPKVVKGDLLVANYLGQIWKGRVFDSSFASGRTLAGFTIGVGQVIPGWDKALVGDRIGSRVMLVIPPADGYGTTGNSQAGITGKDTLVFVIDLVSQYPKTATSDSHASFEASGLPGVTVSGKLASEPKIVVKKNTAQPKAVVMKVLDKGHGPAIKPGLLVYQITVESWASALLESSWSAGPQGNPVGQVSNPSALDKIVGTPLGSRVLFEIPKNSSGGPYAIVVDTVAEPAEPAK